MNDIKWNTVNKVIQGLENNKYNVTDLDVSCDIIEDDPVDGYRQFHRGDDVILHITCKK